MFNNVKYHLLDGFSVHKPTTIDSLSILFQYENNVNSKKMSVMDVHGEKKESHMNVKQMLLYVMRMHYGWKGNIEQYIPLTSNPSLTS